jgi:hypothetical protein
MAKQHERPALDARVDRVGFACPVNGGRAIAFLDRDGVLWHGDGHDDPVCSVPCWQCSGRHVLRFPGYLDEDARYA